MSQPLAGSSARKPAVLFAYHTYTQQTLKVAEEMAGVLGRRGCDVYAWRASLAETRSTRGSSDCADVHIAADACVAER